MKPQTHLAPPPFQKWMALLLVLVMAGFGFVQAVHVHDAVASKSSPESHCPLCVVAHSAALISPASAAVAPVFESARLVVSEPQLQSRLRVASSDIRPPPQDF